MKLDDGLPAKNMQEEPPPFLGTWSHVYVGVLCYLFMLIAGLYALTRMFAF